MSKSMGSVDFGEIGMMHDPSNPFNVQMPRMAVQGGKIYPDPVERQTPYNRYAPKDCRGREVKSAAPPESVFVTKLPRGWDERRVAHLLGGYGKVTKVHIVSRQGAEQTSALVRFKTVKEADWILQNLDGKIPQELGTEVEVRTPAAAGMSGQAEMKMQLDGTEDLSYLKTASPIEVRVDDLPAGMTRNAVWRLFNAYGTVKSVNIISDSPKTAALLRFETEEDAEFVVTKLNNNIPHGLTTPVSCAYATDADFAEMQGSGGGPATAAGREVVD